jgi:hypothetical protein
MTSISKRIKVLKVDFATKKPLVSPVHSFGTVNFFLAIFLHALLLIFTGLIDHCPQTLQATNTTVRYLRRNVLTLVGFEWPFRVSWRYAGRLPKCLPSGLSTITNVPLGAIG